MCAHLLTLPLDQQAITTLLNLAETYGGHAKTMGKDSHGAVKGAHDDDNLQRAEADLKVFPGFYNDNKKPLMDLKLLIERFANSTSSDDLFEAINNIYRDADRDPELKNWFKSMDRYVRRCLQEQGYILKDEATEEWNALYDKGHYLLRDRYRDHTDRVNDEVKFLTDQFNNDPQNQALSQSVQKLFNDLGTDENGKATFKPHLIKDLTTVIIPGIFENTNYIPIPRIEVSDPMLDAIVENLVIESDNLFPNALEFGNDSYFRMGRRSATNKLENKVMVAGSGIQMDLKDVAYYVKKKTGFPSVTDKGVMDIFLGGEGFSFKLAARNAQNKDAQHFVTVENVTVKVKNLNIKLKQSNHKLLFAIAKPLLLRVMTPVITKVLEKQIKANFEKADAYLWDIYQEVQRGAKTAANDPDQASSIWQQYLNAFQQKITDNKEKAKAKSANTTVNVAMTQHDSIFKNIKLPGGVSTKATEFKELAAKGDKWESPVFGIGTASESTNVPRIPEVSRKPHNAASGVVRGGNHPGSAAEQGNYGTNSYTPDTGRDTSNYGGNYGSNTSSYGQNTGVNQSAGFGQQVDQAFNKNQTSGMTNGTQPGAANAARAAYHDSTTMS